MKIIINTNTIWDAPPRARHQLAFALAEMGLDVTFIAGNKTGKPGMQTEQINQNLSVITPVFPVSRRIRYRVPVINEIYQHWLYPILKKEFEESNPYVICSDFGGYLIKNFFSRVVYFASDDYINNVNVPFFIKKYTAYTQKKLIQSADFTIATAKKLVDDFALHNSQSFELPLGAPDFKVEIKGWQKKEAGNKCKVVLLGYIDKVKTPIPLLTKILSLAYTELHLIGPIKDDILDYLQPQERVQVHGVKTGVDLVRILETMDVGIAPYYMEDTNTGRTPNKMWQYLAVGLPAVITNLPNVKEWEFPSGTVYKANDFKEFVDQIALAWHEDSEANYLKRIEVAKNNTWEKRAELLLGYIKNLEYEHV